MFYHRKKGEKVSYALVLILVELEIDPRSPTPLKHTCIPCIKKCSDSNFPTVCL